MSLAVLVTWLNEVNNAYDSYQTFEKHADAAKRAASGKKPYPQSKEVERELGKLENLSKKLRDIASKGIGEADKKLESTDVIRMMPQLEGTDKERDDATRKFRLVQLAMAQFLDAGDELSDALSKIADSAAKRRDAAVQIRDQFEELVDKFPDPTGSAIKTMLFESYQAFESASGALAGVASTAADAKARVDKEVKASREKLKGLVAAFENAYKTGDARRKAKKK